MLVRPKGPTPPLADFYSAVDILPQATLVLDWRPIAMRFEHALRAVKQGFSVPDLQNPLFCLDRHAPSISLVRAIVEGR